MTLVELAVAGVACGATIVGGVWAVLSIGQRDMAHRIQKLEGEVTKLVNRVIELERQIAIEDAIKKARKELLDQFNENRNTHFPAAPVGASLPASP